jgi:hypothetical protein
MPDQSSTEERGGKGVLEEATCGKQKEGGEQTKNNQKQSRKKKRGDKPGETSIGLRRVELFMKNSVCQPIPKRSEMDCKVSPTWMV